MKVLPPTLLLAALGLMLCFHFVMPVARLIPGAWRFIGLGPLGTGLAVNLLADAALRQAMTTVKPIEKPQTLVIWGVFRISRNPMYLGFALILLGVAMLLGTVTSFLAVPAFVALLDVSFIRDEERVLEETFREQWRNYRRQVRRWI